MAGGEDVVGQKKSREPYHGERNGNCFAERECSSKGCGNVKNKIEHGCIITRQESQGEVPRNGDHSYWETPMKTGVVTGCLSWTEGKKQC